MTPRNPNGRTRARVRRLAAAAAVVGFLDSSPARAQNPDVIATYGGLEPKGSFTFKMKGTTYTKPVGLLNWDVPQDQFGTAGLDRAFKAFCAEPLVGVTAGNTYNFNLLSPDDAAAYNLPDTEAGRKEARLRGAYIRELFGRSYTSAVDSNTPDAARAFQVALWELAYEGDLPATFEPGEAKFDLFTGTFQAEYPDRAAMPAFVPLAQTYLKGLTGNDSVFYGGSALAGRELVRLNGLANASGAVAQDQYALRTVVGGAGGNASSAGGGGGGGVGGLGALGGGFGAPVGGGGGAFGGGGGGLLAGTGTNSTTSPPTTATNVPPTSIVGVPPVASPPPNQSVLVPPINTVPPPDTTVPPTTPPPVLPPTNPVPGPPGLILGGIAAVVFAGRRAVTRLTAKK